MASRNNKTPVTVGVAAMSLYLLPGMSTIVSPALQSLSEEYPDVSFTTIMTIGSLPSLLAIPTAIGTGAIIGRKISFRAAAVLGTALAATGALPYVLDSFPLVMVSRGTFGLGYGIILAIMGTVVLRNYSGPARATMLGIGTGVNAAGGMSMTAVAGMLVRANPWLMWLMHLIALVALAACLLWLPEPGDQRDPVEDAGPKPPKEKARLPVGIWVVLALYGIGTTSFYPVFLGSSTVVIEEGLGDSAAAGLILSVFFLGAFLGGLAFGQASKLAGNLALMSAGYLLSCVGMALCAAGQSMPTIYLGAGLVGFGIQGIAMPACYAEFGRVLNAAGMALASGLLMAFGNVGGFIAPYFITFASTVSGDPSPRSGYWAGGMCFAAMAAWLCFASILQRRSTRASAGGEPSAVIS